MTLQVRETGEPGLYDVTLDDGSVVEGVDESRLRALLRARAAEKAGSPQPAPPRATAALERRAGIERSTVPIRPRARRSRAIDVEMAASEPEVVARSRGRCEARAPGCIGLAAHRHHRQRRRVGNSTPVNLLHVCFPCHAWIHGNVKASLARGLLVSSYGDPGEVPVVAFPFDL